MNVKIIQKKGQSALVEWVDKNQTLQRGIVPAVEVNNGVINPDILEEAIPYGEVWSEHIDIDPNGLARTIECKLRQYGVWTVEDALKKPQQFTDALRDAFSLVRSEIIKSAQTNKGDVENG